MSKPDKSKLQELQHIPDVGMKIAEDLWNLGVHSIRVLKDQDSENMYLPEALY